MKKTFAITVLPAVLFAFIVSGCSTPKLIWGHDETGKAKSETHGEGSGGVTPAGLKANKVNPIATKDGLRTTLSRPKILKVEQLKGTAGSRKYFEVIDETAKGSSTPLIDESANPTKVFTYDNNAVQKDYPMRFSVAWSRALEAILDTPLSTVDRSSGVIITEWVVDKMKSSTVLDVLTPVNTRSFAIRYRYTIRMLDRGSYTQIKVIPFAEVRDGRKWVNAKPSIVVTNSMFDRIEQELRTPLAGEQF